MHTQQCSQSSGEVECDYLLAECLIHLREEGELPQSHAAEGEVQGHLSHSFIYRDEVVPQQPELIEENGWVVLHVGHVKGHVLCNLHSITVRSVCLMQHHSSRTLQTTFSILQ